MQAKPRGDGGVVGFELDRRHYPGYCTVAGEAVTEDKLYSWAYKLMCF